MGKEIEKDSKKNIIIKGSTVPMRTFTPTQFKQAEKMSVWDKMKQSGTFFATDGVVQNIFLTQVAIGCKKFTHRTQNDPKDTIKKVYDQIALDLDLNHFYKSFYLASLIYANLIVVEMWGKKKYYFGKRPKELTVPVGLTLIDPVSGRILGSILGQDDQLGLKVSRSELDLYNEKALNEINDKYLYPIFDGEYKSKTFRDQGITIGETVLKFNPESASLFNSIGFDWERYATPKLCGVFDALQRKRKLQEADFAILDGIINTIYLFKLGSDEFPVEDSDELTNFANLLRNPAKNFGLVWNHRIQLQIECPDTGLLTDSSKYSTVNNEIREGLGYSFLLTDSKGRRDVDKLVKIFCEVVDLERNEIARWAENRLYKRIAEKNNLPSYPSIRFNQISLAIDDILKTFIGLFYDRGLVSKHTGMSTMDLSYEEELELKKREKPDDKFFTVPELPFSKSSPGTPSDRNPDNKEPDVKETSLKAVLGNFLDSLDKETQKLLAERLTDASRDE